MIQIPILLITIIALYVAWRLVQRWWVGKTRKHRPRLRDSIGITWSQDGETAFIGPTQKYVRLDDGKR